MKKSTFYLTCASCAMLLLNTSCSFDKKKEDLLRQLQKDIFTSQERLQKDIDEMVLENSKHTERLRKDAREQYALTTAKTSLSIKSNGCQYDVRVKGLNKAQSDISYDGIMLSIAGRTKAKNPYSYSLSVPKNCIGEPNVEYEKDMIKISFDQ